MCDFGLDNHLINDAGAPVLRVSAGSPPHALAGSIHRACVWNLRFICTRWGLPPYTAR
ncbi:MAG: hypothetical protein R2873_21335 [Caldilineaceae bacterium]